MKGNDGWMIMMDGCLVNYAESIPIFIGLVWNDITSFYVRR